MNSWMTKLKRIGPDSTESFKYIIPAEVYYLIDYTVMRPHQFMTEFFTDNTRHYKDISNYFKKQGYNNISEEYEPVYNCWCIEIIDPRINVLIDQFNDPYNYMGEDSFIENAIKLGYSETSELENDFIDYHNRIGAKFHDLGLLPKINEIPKKGT